MIMRRCGIAAFHQVTYVGWLWSDRPTVRRVLEIHLWIWLCEFVVI